MSAPEFSRMVRLRPLPQEPVELIPGASERAALADRFDVTEVSSLIARVSLGDDGKAVTGEGTLEADIIQACAISGDDFPVRISEKLALRFVPAGAVPEVPDAEIELDPNELDDIEYSGDSFDLGEAVAQSLGLAIDPYAEGPNADAVRKKAGIVTDDTPSGPLAEALSALKKG